MQGNTLLGASRGYFDGNVSDFGSEVTLEELRAIPTPKKTETVRLYHAYYNGKLCERLHTKDGKQAFDGAKLYPSYWAHEDKLVFTNCFADVEVEV